MVTEFQLGTMLTRHTMNAWSNAFNWKGYKTLFADPVTYEQKLITQNLLSPKHRCLQGEIINVNKQHVYFRPIPIWIFLQKQRIIHLNYMNNKSSMKLGHSNLVYEKQIIGANCQNKLSHLQN